MKVSQINIKNQIGAFGTCSAREQTEVTSRGKLIIAPFILNSRLTLVIPFLNYFKKILCNQYTPSLGGLQWLDKNEN